MINIRAPVAAGEFYNLERELLIKEIESSFKHKLGPKSFRKRNVKVGIVPHGNYLCSGPVAAWVYSRMNASNYVILGANHQKSGSTFAISKEGLWKTPLGAVAIDKDVAEKIVEFGKFVEYDIIPHQNEYSIEVQLPFLQHRFGSDFKFVPILVTNQFADGIYLEQCKSVGKSIATSIKKSKKKWMILASSDFSSFSENISVKNADKPIINAIKKLNVEKFFEEINKGNSNLCGYGTIATAIVAAKEMRARKAELLKYATSAEVIPGEPIITGYASMIIY